MPYIKEVFQPTNLQHAKDICLSPDSNDPDKFQKETDFFVEWLIAQGFVSSDLKIADFGCGVGRISRELIIKTNCNIMGFDISSVMMDQAISYINSPNFTSHVFNDWIPYNDTTKYDTVIASLVLQHSEYPIKAIEFISNIIEDTGYFILVNEGTRFVPYDVDPNGWVIWKDDGINIEKEVNQYFDLVSKHNYYTRKDKCLSVWRKKVNTY